MNHLQGFRTEQFTPLAEQFADNLASGKDVGASLCVMLGDEVVVDLWGGLANEHTATPWDRDTIILTFSTTKMMCNLVTLLLHDRGQLDIFAPVADLWPEFAAKGKAGITTAHIMSHTSGVAGFDGVDNYQQLADWDFAVSTLAAQSPWWEPGTASGYHGHTYGFLLGEICRRAVGETLREVLRREFIEPLGADFFIGLPPSEDRRLAQIVPWLGQGEGGPLGERTMTPGPDAGIYEEWFRRADLPSANGIGNARSVALLQSVITNDGVVNGHRFLTSETCDFAFRSQHRGIDLVLGSEFNFSLGYGLSTEAFNFGPRTACWGGAGGSMTFLDQELGLTMSYVMNKMAPFDNDSRADDLFFTTRKIFGK